MSKEIGDVILDLQNISLRFGGVKALTDISFDVREHEIRAIIGPNGAGKSSMLNVINGVYHPQEGRDHVPRRGAQADGPAPGGPPGDLAHLPEHRAVQGHERPRQHHDRAQPQDEEQPAAAGDLVGPGAQRGTRRIGPRSRRSSTSSKSSTSARRRSAACPTACRSGSTSVGRWPWSRRSCCSTSRWPA